MLSDVYFSEIGSVLTLNDLFRASFGAAFPLFANAMFKRLGIGGWEFPAWRIGLSLHPCTVLVPQVVSRAW